MKYFLPLIIIIISLVSGCSILVTQVDEDFVIESYTATPTPKVTKTPVTPKPTNTPEPTPTVIPTIVDSSVISANSLNSLVMDNIDDNSQQVILVTVDGRNEQLYLMDKVENGLWQVSHGPFEVQIGRNGLGKEEEGDAKSPIGVYALGTAFGMDGPPEGTKWSWRETEKGDIFIEDSESKYYNQFVQESNTEKDWKDISDLDIYKYRRAVEVKYNPENIPNKGSAIFIHVWGSSKEPTQGCTALSSRNIDTLISWLEPGANPVLMQLPYESYLPKGLSYAIDYAPYLVTDIKYAGRDNITMSKLDGYDKNYAVVSTETAKALGKASDMAYRNDKYLVLYDGYRPKTANTQLNTWLKEPKNKELRQILFKDMYKYEMGKCVDIGLMDRDMNTSPIGGEYQDTISAEYDAIGLSDEEYNNREMLRNYMYHAGFNISDNMWWYFILDSNTRTKYDITIE